MVEVLKPNKTVRSLRSMTEKTQFITTNWPIKSIGLVIFVIRLINALTIQTFFQPDEFYQSLEPAHSLVFGYGYITWEWKHALRTSIHPLLYALGYKLGAIISKLTGTNEATLVMLMPKIIGAIMATIGEIHLYKWALTYSRNGLTAKFVLILSLLNPFNWYIITRSFSNSLEMILTTVALAYWPWRSIDTNRLYLSCCFAFISCIIRPTNAIIWMILGVYFIIPFTPSDIIKVGFKLMIEFTVVIGITMGLDRLFYGYFTLPLYNFIEFNVIKNLSIFYGSSPWHFHIFQSVPVMLMTYLPLFLYSVIKFKLYGTILGMVSMGTLILFSIIDHKEFRFIYPLMPIFLLFSSYSLKDIYLKRKYFKGIMITMTVINAMIAIVFNNINEKGEMDIIQYLRTNQLVNDFGFLTPCHSTPWQSHLHNPMFESSSWFITCEPPLHLDKATLDIIKTYRDESDQLFDDPIGFMNRNFPTKYNWPSHLIIYENFIEMHPILIDNGYNICHRVFNSYFHWDPRRRGDLVVYCK